MFTSSTKREIRQFHVVLIQSWQRNAQNSVMQVQSCCFGNLSLLLFCRSRWRRPRRCLRGHSTRGSKSCVRIGYPNWQDGTIPWPLPPPPHPLGLPANKNLVSSAVLWRKLDQESWSPMLGIFSTWTSTILSNFLQLIAPSVLVERRSTEFGVCGTKALN